VTAIIRPAGPGSTFAHRLRRRDHLLGALLGPGPLPAEALDGLDFLVMTGPGSLHAVAATALPVLVQVASAAEVPSALEAGAAGVLVDAETPQQAAAAAAAATSAARAWQPVVIVAGPRTLASVPGVDAVLADGGNARRVTSPAAARRAHADGAGLVLYDLPAMVTALLSTLPSGRQPAADRPGQRETLVLLSGMLGDTSLWDDLAARLGDLVLPCPARIDLDDSVREMAATVLAQAPDRFGVLGHSLGAVVALEMMRQAPGRITSLALMNASARGPSDAQLTDWDRCRRRVLHGEFTQVVNELAMATLGRPGRDDEALLARTISMARTVGADGFLRQLSAQTTRPDSLVSVGRIEVPVLVVSGAADEVCPPALQQELAERCPPAELVSVAGGHMLPLECPDAVAGHLRAWLGGHRLSQ